MASIEELTNAGFDVHSGDSAGKYSNSFGVIYPESFTGDYALFVGDGEVIKNILSFLPFYIFDEESISYYRVVSVISLYSKNRWRIDFKDGVGIDDLVVDYAQLEKVSLVDDSAPGQGHPEVQHIESTSVQPIVRKKIRF